MPREVVRLWKIFKYAKNMEKNEENPCSIRFNTPKFYLIPCTQKFDFEYSIRQSYPSPLDPLYTSYIISRYRNSYIRWVVGSLKNKILMAKIYLCNFASQLSKSEYPIRSYDQAPPRNKRFLLKFLSHQNASKFAICIFLIRKPT